MGTASSKQRLGERVVAALAKLKEDRAMQAALKQQIESASPETLRVMVQSIEASFASCSAFSERTLLVAFAASPEEVERVLRKSCKQVLSAPIDTGQFAWLQQYVLPSSVWLMRANHESGQFLYEQLLDITESMGRKIQHSMQSIFQHLRAHQEWGKVLAIENETVVARQDDARVGLLNEQGIRDIADAKQDDKELASFIDSNLAVNLLTTTAKQVNGEFQQHLKAVMSRYGAFRAGVS